ncbi:GTPase IMAP family member 8-like [Megalobrama amblycephala]|uniref:GTPase IMAP family member 8-like n=1 Tax=Megalobrama amblycephala TaxID=75352 RepID=UPI0020142DC4|nr:GTPase IMAP family member 8-like [Megalobrama amblycephala]
MRRVRDQQAGHTSKMERSLNFVLLGKKGAGKSSSGNTLLGRDAFKSKKSLKLVTRDVAVESETLDRLQINVYDTPGFCDPEMSEDEIQQMINEKVFQKCESGPCVFLLVIKAESFTQEEKETVEKIEKLLGENHFEKTWILFTKGDELEQENMTIEEFLNEFEPLKKLVEKYDQRYHVFNNKIKSDQCRILLIKMIQRSLGFKASDGGRLQRRIPAIRAKTHDDQKTVLSFTRLVLMGKTGVGKSATGNTILGQREFESESGMGSVSHECLEKHTTVSGRTLTVVDTPGFFDTNMKPEQFMKEMARCVYLSSPGPHAFLIVFPANQRFTDQEVETVDHIEIFFGEEVSKYSIILFTHGDLLEGKSIEKNIAQNSRVRHLVQKCGGRFHIFNNKDQNNRKQVNDLLKMIDTMVEQNGGYYSNQMLEDAQKFRQEQEKRKQKEEEEGKQREGDQGKAIQLTGNNSEFENFLKNYEHRFIFSAFAFGKLDKVALGAAICGLTALILMPVGPVFAAGVCAGAAVGAGVGAGVGYVWDRLLK